MGVTVVSKKTQNVEDIDTADFIDAEVVDQYVRTKNKVAKFMAKIEPKVNKLEKLQANVLKLVDENVNAALKITLVGDEYELPIGARGNKTELINADLAKDLLGEEVFMKLAKVTLTDLKDYLTKEDYETVTKTSRKNSRRIGKAKKL